MVNNCLTCDNIIEGMQPGEVRVCDQCGTEWIATMQGVERKEQ